MADLDCPVPSDVLDEIVALAAARRARRIPVKGSVVAAYLRRNRGTPFRSAVWSMPSYLREVWDVDHRWQLPSTFAVRLARRLVR